MLETKKMWKRWREIKVRCLINKNRRATIIYKERKNNWLWVAVGEERKAEDVGLEKRW